MRSFAVIAAAVGIASAHASGSWGAPVYVTDVVTAYTTYCPEATHITHGSVTYTVTEPTTLTITNCPCTVTRPVSSSVSSSSICTGVPPVSKPPVSSGSPVPPPVSSSYNVPSVSPSATSSAPVSTYTGSAAKVQVAGGLLAALGLVAAAL